MSRREIVSSAGLTRREIVSSAGLTRREIVSSAGLTTSKNFLLFIFLYVLYTNSVT